MTDFRLQRDEVHAPLAAPTYLTHVTAPAFRRGRFITIAVALHVIAVVAFLIVLQLKYHPAPPEEPTLSLVVTNQPFTGTGPQVISQAPAEPMPRPIHELARRPATHPGARRAPPESISQNSSLETAQPANTAARPAAAAAPPRPASQPAPAPAASVTHLGDDQPAGTGLVMDTQVIPAVPDATVNLPPEYPREALLHGEQGRVLLSIHVLPDGRPGLIGVADSSGYTVLDQAALLAVTHWQFQPAQRGGKAVASVLPFWISFELN